MDNVSGVSNPMVREQVVDPTGLTARHVARRNARTHLRRRLAGTTDDRGSGSCGSEHWNHIAVPNHRRLRLGDCPRSERELRRHRVRCPKACHDHRCRPGQRGCPRSSPDDAPDTRVTSSPWTVTGVRNLTPATRGVIVCSDSSLIVCDAGESGAVRTDPSLGVCCLMPRLQRSTTVPAGRGRQRRYMLK